jgi:hypothetical protein
MVSAGDLARRELNAHFIHSQDAVIVAVVASCISLIISFIHLYRHLHQYTMPQIQMWIIRVILICPAYAICSSVAFAVGLPNGSYVEFARDLYEAFVVYSLLNLIMEYCGGEQDCLYAIENEAPLNMPFPMCCMKPKARDAKLLRWCQRGVLQFVFVKPIMATADVIMTATGNYYNPIFTAVETVIYNIAYCAALYSLLVMYLATQSQLEKFKCVSKIATVKSIIVISYYQSLFIKLAPVTENEQFLWQNFITSLEMVVFAAVLACAFPISEFMAGIPNRRVLSNMKDLFAVKDLMEGFEHNFNAEYQDYALQRQMAEAAPTDSTRLRTYFGSKMDDTALEMTERYRGRSSRLQFNSLLRGDRPIRAGIRRERADTSSLLRSMYGDLEYGVAPPEDSEEEEEGGENDDEEEIILNPISGSGGAYDLQSSSSSSSSGQGGDRRACSPRAPLPAIHAIAPPRPADTNVTPLTKIATRKGKGRGGGGEGVSAFNDGDTDDISDNDNNDDDDGDDMDGDHEGNIDFQSFHGAASPKRARGVIGDETTFFAGAAAGALRAKGAEEYEETPPRHKADNEHGDHDNRRHPHAGDEGSSPGGMSVQGSSNRGGGGVGADSKEEDDEEEKELGRPILQDLLA